jgi:hypothetical protein
MSWEPLPLDIAEWMGMDDDHLRVAQVGQPVDVPDASPAVVLASHDDAAA